MGVDIDVGVKNARVKSGLAEIRSQVRQFSGSLSGMFAGAFGAGAIISFAEKMREVRNEAARFGTSAESIQRIGKVARSADVDFDTLAKTMNRVTLEAAKAAQGGGQSDIFEKLGIDAARFVGLSMEQKILVLSEAFQHARQSGVETGAMLELLGNRGAEIAPLLARGPDALSKGMQEATVQTSATVEAMAKLSKSLDMIKGTGARSLGWVADKFVALSKGIGYTTSILKDMFIDGTGFDDAFNKAGDAAAENGDDEITGTGTETPANDFEAGAGDEEKKKALRKQISEEVERAKVAELSGQARINALAEQRAALDSKINDSTVEGLEAKKQAVSLDHQLSEAKRQQQQLVNSLLETEARYRVEELSGEAKLRELAKQRAGLESKINESTAEGIEAKKKALALDHDITAEKNRQREASMTTAKEAASEAVRKVAGQGAEQKSGLARARKGEADELERQYLDKASPKDKKKYLTDKQNRLMKESKEASASGDAVTAIEKRTEATALQPDIDKAGKGAARGMSVAVDSLQRAGGGGGIGPSAGDPATRQRDKTNELLRKIADAVGAKGGTAKRSDHHAY